MLTVREVIEELQRHPMDAQVVLQGGELEPASMIIEANGTSAVVISPLQVI